MWLTPRFSKWCADLEVVLVYRDLSGEDKS